MCKEGKVALLLGKGVAEVRYTVMEEVDECIMYWIRKEEFVVWRANRQSFVPSSL